MPTTINFGGSDATPIVVGSQRVSTRARWADNWTVQPDLHCLEATWSCAPSLPTATLVWDYGKILRETADAYATVAKKTGLHRGYVKVEFDTDFNAALNRWNTRTWYGVIELEVDDILGAIVDPRSRPPLHHVTGHQTFQCFGMETLLRTANVRRSWFKDHAGATQQTERRVPFNSRGQANRTAAKVGGAYLFEHDLRNALFWNTADIVEYTLARLTPRDNADATLVPFTLDATLNLPAWDKPQLGTEDATAYSILERMIDRRRLFLWWLEVEAGENINDPDNVVLKFNTMTRNAVTIDLPAAADIPANTRQINLICDQDQATTYSVRDSDVARYDVIVCYGADELSVGSFSYVDTTLSDGWTAAHQTAYDAGGVIAGQTRKVQEQRNRDARSRPELAKVYSHFRIPLAWDGRVGNGIGGGKTPLFAKTVGGGWPFYYPETFIRPTLPLFQGVDYSGNVLTTGVTEPADHREEMETLAVFKRPDTGTWIKAENMGANADGELLTKATENTHFSVHVRVPPHSHAVELKVSGAPQHAIATQTFVPNAADKPLGAWTFYSGMIVTLCLPTGRRVQGRYPAADPANVDAVRYLLIDAGEEYREVYVAPGTVVGVSQTGTLQRCNGGWVPKPGQDDATHQLTAIAKIAAAWYTNPHRVLVLETQRLRSDLGLGDMIITLGDPAVPGGNNQTLNSPITEIKISWPRGTPAATSPPTMTITTFAGELDPLSFAPMPLIQPPPVAPPKRSAAWEATAAYLAGKDK